MKSGAAKISRPPVHRVIIVQVFVTFICYMITLLIWGNVNAYSAALGGIASIVPNAIFILKAFSISGASQARNIVNAFYKGEALKIVVTATLFIMIFVLVKPLSVISLFIVFIIVQAVNWFTPLLIKQPKR